MYLFFTLLKGVRIVTPVTVSGITQTLQPFPSEKQSMSTQGDLSTSTQSSTGSFSSINSNIPLTLDTVTLSDRPLESVRSPNKEEVKKDEAARTANSEKTDRAMSKVQFVYSPKGDLSIRYLDTADRLIYQVPSELMLRFAEALSKSDSSVDTKV